MKKPFKPHVSDPGAELSCLYHFLSLNCRINTIENILWTARRKNELQRPEDLAGFKLLLCMPKAKLCLQAKIMQQQRGRCWYFQASLSPAQQPELFLWWMPPCLGQSEVPGTGESVCSTQCLPGEGSWLGHMGCKCCRSCHGRMRGELNLHPGRTHFAMGVPCYTSLRQGWIVMLGNVRDNGI